MVTERTASLVSRLEDQVASGIVWNADFEDFKFRLGSEYDKARDELQKLVNLPESAREEFPGANEVYWALPYGLFQLTSLVKKLGTFGKLPAEAAQALAVFVTDWSAIRTLLYVEAKPLIKKGRKPADTPSLTEPRTLESTGTCSICGRNVKYDEAGKIVNHGYSVQYHSFSAGCYGVGFRPFEVSAEGAVRYIDALRVYVEQEKGILASFENGTRTTIFSERLRANIDPGHDLYDATKASIIRELAYTIKSLESNILYFEKKVAEWAPATLPGIAAGFAK